MFHSLREGRSSLYLQREHTGHSIGAVKFEVQFSDGRVVVRLSLRPIDRNQRQDEDYLHEQALKSITLDDSYVIDQLRSYVNAQRGTITSWAIEIVSRSKLFSFVVTVTQSKQHAYEALHFVVQPNDA